MHWIDRNAMEIKLNTVRIDRNTKYDEQEEVSVAKRVLKENGRLMALRLLVSQQLTAPVVLFVTGITFVLLLWRPTQCFSTGEHVGVMSIFAGEGFPRVWTWRGPSLLMLLVVLVQVTFAVVRSPTLRPGARKLLPLWVMCSLMKL